VQGQAEQERAGAQSVHDSGIRPTGGQGSDPADKRVATVSDSEESTHPGEMPGVWVAVED
jgi:hypothetical protein